MYDDTPIVKGTVSGDMVMIWMDRAFWRGTSDRFLNYMLCLGFF